MSLRPLVGAPLAALLLLASPGCHDRRLLGPFEGRAAPATEPMDWIAVDSANLEAQQRRRPGSVSYRLQLPDRSARPELRQVELRFLQPLDGAKVDARATGPRQALTVLEGKRVAGETVTIPLGSLEVDEVELVVHHHQRPLPLVRAVRLGRSVRRMD